MRAKLGGILLLAVLVLGASHAMAQMITVPNGNFNDNSDGDLLDVDLWTDGENQGDDEVQQVANAVGKSAGDLVMRVGFRNDFANPVVSTGVNFDSSAPSYVLSLDARAFNDIDLTTSDPDDVVPANRWGYLIRDVTNGNNIKTVGGGQPGFPAIDSWGRFDLTLTQEEMLQYEIDNEVDIDAAEIGIRIYKNSGSDDFLGVDNVTLEIADLPIPGDVDGDGFVDLDDYAIIRDNMLRTPATRLQGDIFPVDIRDGEVTLEDFRLWKDEFLSAGGTLEQIAAFNAVPEPSGLLVALGTVVALAVGSRRRG